MPNKRTGMDYLDYSGSKPKKKKPLVKSVGTVDFNINTAKGLTAYNKAKKKKKKDTRYNPFNDGRTPTSASQTTGP